MSQTFNDRRALQLVAARTLNEAGIEGPIESDEDDGPGFWRGVLYGLLISACFYAFVVLAFTADRWGAWIDSAPASSEAAERHLRALEQLRTEAQP